MNHLDRKQRSLVAELIVALLVVVLMLAWSGTAFGEQKSITLPKGTKVEKIGTGHFKFKLPDGQVVEAKGLVKSGDVSSTISELGIYDHAGKLTASSKGVELKTDKTITRESTARMPQADYMMIDGKPIFLPATIFFQMVGTKEFSQASRVQQATKTPKSATELSDKSHFDASDAKVNVGEVLKNLNQCQQDNQELIEKNNTLEQQNNALKQQNSTLQQKLNDATKPGGSAVKAYCESPTVSRNTAGATNDCATTGYMCEPVSGLCRTSCSKTADECAKGYACDAGYSWRCIK